MPILSNLARVEKVRFFLRDLEPRTRLLEVGCASQWLKEALAEQGSAHYEGIDLAGPADYLGDVRNWRELGMKPGSYDVIAAFEVIEHVDCLRDLYDLLKPGGRLLLTSPHPNWDWACRLLETARLTQPRTSPHCNLVDFERLPLFEPLEIRRYRVLAQWGVFRKPSKEEGVLTHA
jgi:2-polyprenyl-3-methyl-5-hydroxy-6-metoxy-1,4-benzoquinol methylase